MKKTFIATSVYLVVTLIIYWFAPFGESNKFIEKILYESYSVAMVVAGLSALIAFGTSGPRAKSLMLMLLGIGMWAAGDLIWNYLEYTQGEIPFPSLGDYCYLIGYPALFLGLFKEFTSFKIKLKNFKKIFVVYALFSLACIAGFTYMSIYLTYDMSAPIGQNIVTIGYGIGDLLLVVSSFILLCLMWEYKGGKIATTWLFLFIGFWVTMIGDVLYGMFTTQFESGTGLIPDLVNSFYIIGLLFVFYAFYYLRFSIVKLQQKITS